MQTIRAKNVAGFVGSRVVIQGWLHTVRKLGSVGFIVVRDGTGLVQAVAESAEIMNQLNQLTFGSVVRLAGDVVATQQTASGFELLNPTLEIIEPITETHPLTLNKRSVKANLPHLLNHAVVANRHPSKAAIFKLSAGVMASFRSTLNQRGFTEFQSPKIVASATESGANVFEIDYFGRKAYLAQSPQFYKQMMVGIFERVYEVGPVFRAEPHDTIRHLAEYVSLDVEFGFIENHFTVMAIAEKVIRGILDGLLAGYSAELNLLAAEMPTFPDTFPKIQFNEAQQLIFERHGVDVRGEPDLSPQDERWLGAWAKEEFNSDFLFVYGQPMSKRPFYTYANDENPADSNSFDLLFRGMELITGGQRLHRYADYLAALEKANLPVEPFETYLSAFKYGMPPHGGFAIGLERFLTQLLQLPNVRLATLFPRDLNRVTP